MEIFVAVFVVVSVAAKRASHAAWRGTASYQHALGPPYVSVIPGPDPRIATASDGTERARYFKRLHAWRVRGAKPWARTFTYRHGRA